MASIQQEVAAQKAKEEEAARIEAQEAQEAETALRMAMEELRRADDAARRQRARNAEADEYVKLTNAVEKAWAVYGQLCEARRQGQNVDSLTARLAEAQNEELLAKQAVKLYELPEKTSRFPTEKQAKAAKQAALKHARLKLEAHFDEEADDELVAPECEAGKRREKRLALDATLKRIADMKEKRKQIAILGRAEIAWEDAERTLARAKQTRPSSARRPSSAQKESLVQKRRILRWREADTARAQKAVNELVQQGADLQSVKKSLLDGKEPKIGSVQHQLYGALQELQAAHTEEEKAHEQLAQVNHMLSDAGARLARRKELAAARKTFAQAKLWVKLTKLKSTLKEMKVIGSDPSDAAKQTAVEEHVKSTQAKLALSVAQKELDAASEEASKTELALDTELSFEKRTTLRESLAAARLKVQAAQQKLEEEQKHELKTKLTTDSLLEARANRTKAKEALDVAEAHVWESEKEGVVSARKGCLAKLQAIAEAFGRIAVEKLAEEKEVSLGAAFGDGMEDDGRAKELEEVLAEAEGKYLMSEAAEDALMPPGGEDSVGEGLKKADSGIDEMMDGLKATILRLHREENLSHAEEWVRKADDAVHVPEWMSVRQAKQKLWRATAAQLSVEKEPRDQVSNSTRKLAQNAVDLAEEALARKSQKLAAVESHLCFKVTEDPASSANRTATIVKAAEKGVQAARAALTAVEKSTVAAAKAKLSEAQSAGDAEWIKQCEASLKVEEKLSAIEEMVYENQLSYDIEQAEAEAAMGNSRKQKKDSIARLVRRWQKGTDASWRTIKAKQQYDDAKEALKTAVLDANSTCETELRVDDLLNQHLAPGGAHGLLDTLMNQESGSSLSELQAARTAVENALVNLDKAKKQRETATTFYLTGRIWDRLIIAMPVLLLVTLVVTVFAVPTPVVSAGAVACFAILTPVMMMLGKWRFEQAIPDLLLNERAKDASENEFVLRGPLSFVLGALCPDFKDSIAEKVSEIPALGGAGLNFRMGSEDAKQVRTILSAMNDRQRADPCGWALLQRAAWVGVKSRSKEVQRQVEQFRKHGWVYTHVSTDQPELSKDQETFLDETMEVVDVHDVVDTEVFKSINKPALINLILKLDTSDEKIQRSDLEAMAETFVVQFEQLTESGGCCGGSGTDKDVVQRVRENWKGYISKEKSTEEKAVHLRELKADLQEVRLFPQECVRLSDSMFVFDRETKTVLHTGFDIWWRMALFLPFISLIPALLMANSDVEGQLASLGTFVFIMSLWSLGWMYCKSIHCARTHTCILICSVMMLTRWLA